MNQEMFWKPDFIILGQRDDDGKNVSIIAARGEEIISGLIRNEREYDELRTWASAICARIETRNEYFFETRVRQFTLMRGKTFGGVLRSLFRSAKP